VAGERLDHTTRAPPRCSGEATRRRPIIWRVEMLDGILLMGGKQKQKKCIRKRMEQQMKKTKESKYT